MCPSHLWKKEETTMRTSSILRSIKASLVRSHRCRGYASVAILGAAGGIGQPLALLMKLNPSVSMLSLYDIANTTGVSIDISHINTNSEVRLGKNGVEEVLNGVEEVLWLGPLPELEEEGLEALKPKLKLLRYLV